MVELFDTWLRTLGAWGYALLGVASLIEYLFPPFPGDTISVFGGAYVARGERSWELVLLALTAGSMVGISVNWWLGRLLGERVDRLPEGRIVPGLTHERIRQGQKLMKTRGDVLLIVNRFMPSFRSVLFVAAGASGMPLGRVLLLGTLSALMWNGLLVLVGFELGGNAERVEHFLSTWRSGALVVSGLVVAVVLARLWWKRRHPG